MKFFTGTVYTKALAIFLAASLLLLGAVAGLTQLIIFGEFKLAEQREMQAMLQRFSVVMARESKPLEVSVNEWARSDFVQEALTGSPRKFEKAITPMVLWELNIDFVALYDGRGELQELVTLNREMEGMLEGGDPVTSALADIATGEPVPKARVGYVLLGQRLCSMTVSPIDRPDGEFPGGTLVGGKLVGPGTWRFFEGLFSATIKFHDFKNTVVNEGAGRDMANLLNQQEVVIETADTAQITGYRLVNGIGGLPIGYVSISQARPLRQHGLRAIQVFLSGICLAGGGLVLVVWGLLDRTILARITDLTRKLDAEKLAGRLPVKLDFKGEDELGILARSIEDLALLLESTQTQYRTVVEDQTEIICRFDADGRLTFANQVFVQQFGKEAQLGENPDLNSLLPQGAGEELFERFRSLTAEMPLSSYSHKMEGQGTDPRWFRSTLRKNFSPGGESVGGQWVAADITAQVEAQSRSSDSERRFRRLFETASDGILVVEEQTLVITDINPGLCRMLMVAGAEVMERPLAEVEVFAPCLDMVHYFRRSHQGGEQKAPFRNECRLERGDGSSLFVELRCSEYESSGSLFVQMNFRNISDRVLGEKELRKLSAKLLRLQDEERRKIARELHDSTAQNLSALEMNMSLLEPLVAGGSGRAQKLVEETRRIAGECSRELRNISYLLHPPLIDEVGLAFAIRWFADGFAKRTGIATQVNIEEGFPRLDSDIEMPLFRVVQEAMTNIYRHSGARNAWVNLQREGQFLNLQIRDDGSGIDGGEVSRTLKPENFPEISPGVGLAGMRERLANLGGKLDIENSAQGVTLSIRLTLDQLHANPET